MADQYVQVTPDSTGKKIQTYENTVSGQTVETQAVVLADVNAAPISTSNPLPAGVVIGTLAGAATINSTVFETGHILKASAGTLVSLMGHTTAASTQYIQLFNSTTIPADGTAPRMMLTLPASSDFSVDLPITGMPFTTGISVSNSSTTSTKTSGSPDVWFCAVVV